MAETNYIDKVCLHDTANSALPTLASKGNNITQSDWSTAGFDTIGSVDGYSDDLELDEETISYVVDRQRLTVDPARGLGIHNIIPIKNRVTEVSFVVYGGSETLFDHDSDMVIANNIGEFGLTGTMRSLAIAISGLWVDSFGNCLIQITDVPGGAYAGDGNVQKTLVTAYIAKSTAAKGGWERQWYI